MIGEIIVMSLFYIMCIPHRSRMSSIMILLTVPLIITLYFIFIVHKQLPTFLMNEMTTQQREKVSYLQSIIAKLNRDISDTVAERDYLRQKIQMLTNNLTHQIHVMSSEKRDQWMGRYLVSEQAENRLSNGGHNMWGCRELKTIEIIDSAIGQGFSKLVQEGVYGTTHVAVKSASPVVKNVQDCLKSGKYKKEEDCFLLSNYNILKEALMLHELKHPNIGKLLGLCVKSEKPSPSIHLRGVTSVQELGRPVECNWLKKLPWIKRFKICQSIASLLEYLANSPLGSLQIVDFKYQQFVMIDNVIKLIDLDDVSSVEPECNDMPCVIEGKQNMAGIVCRDFHCQGMNTARNLIQAYKLFFNPLLPGDVPAKLHSLVSRLLADIENMNINTRELVKSLQLVEKQWFLLKN